MSRSAQHFGPAACNGFISIQKINIIPLFSLLIEAFSLTILSPKFRQSATTNENRETLCIVKQGSCYC
ncbi:hypothetical protein BT93_I0843 [Corymbia citriodora subsp. variegata]|nr:hypothetical protein BT93_I0843 [Corymbia citriodora subsp. variegata]